MYELRMYRYLNDLHCCTLMYIYDIMLSAFSDIFLFPLSSFIESFSNIFFFTFSIAHKFLSNKISIESLIFKNDRPRFQSIKHGTGHSLRIFIGIIFREKKKKKILVSAVRFN